MMKIRIIILSLLIFIIGCADKNNNESALTFGALVHLEKLQKVTMRNNSGTFDLTTSQIDQIKKDLSQMVYDPNISVKVGAINIELIIDEKKYTIGTATHGDYIEVEKSIITKNKNTIKTSGWLYFKTNGINFDNYKKED